jgi:four helix bundle protein
MENIRGFRELQVYEAAVEGAMEIFGLTKAFPEEDRYAMVDQMRRSSRSVCANTGEA